LRRVAPTSRIAAKETFMTLRRKAVLLAATLILAVRADAKVTRYLTGNAADVSPALHGPAHDLGGGGTDVDAAFQTMFDRVRGCTGAACTTKLDVVILRSTGSNGYNDYLFAMNGVDSVETLVVTQAADSNKPDVVATVQNAEVVFFAGGDQCDYVKVFRGTGVEAAVQSVYARGGGVGGTSAGEAIMGDYAYDGCNGSVTSSQALSDPFDRRITFTNDFFDWPNLGGTITDSHFVTRDRMGRTMAFLARLVKGGAPSVLAIAVNEATSVDVNAAGLATVIGSGPAYFVLADHVPEVCNAKTPLTYSGYKIWKVNGGGTFNLANRPSTGYYVRSVTNGAIDADPY
jgi:cyanophycinase-like exopeptidase